MILFNPLFCHQAVQHTCQGDCPPGPHLGQVGGSFPSVHWAVSWSTRHISFNEIRSQYNVLSLVVLTSVQQYQVPWWILMKQFNLRKKAMVPLLMYMPVLFYLLNNIPDLHYYTYIIVIHYNFTDDQIQICFF